MIKICQYCKNEFDTNNKKKRCCSRSCENKLRYSTTDFKEKIANHFNKIISTEEFKDAHKQRLKSRWESKDFKKDYSHRMSERCSTIEHKEKYSKVFKLTWEAKREEITAKFSALWKNKEFIDNQFRLRFKRKEYILPSGKIVKVQGYEPKALSELLKLFKEDDILIGTEFGFVEYEYEGKKRKYFPDFFIKSKNLIIEVKSVWTFNLHKNLNLEKEKSCLRQGYNFEFMIF